MNEGDVYFVSDTVTLQASDDYPIAYDTELDRYSAGSHGLGEETLGDFDPLFFGPGAQWEAFSDSPPAGSYPYTVVVTGCSLPADPGAECVPGDIPTQTSTTDVIPPGGGGCIVLPSPELVAPKALPPCP